MREGGKRAGDLMDAQQYHTPTHWELIVRCRNMHQVTKLSETICLVLHMKWINRISGST